MRYLFVGFWLSNTVKDFVVGLENGQSQKEIWYNTWSGWAKSKRFGRQLAAESQQKAPEWLIMLTTLDEKHGAFSWRHAWLALWPVCCCISDWKCGRAFLLQPSCCSVKKDMLMALISFSLSVWGAQVFIAVRDQAVLELIWLIVYLKLLCLKIDPNEKYIVSTCHKDIQPRLVWVLLNNTQQAGPCEYKSSHIDIWTCLTLTAIHAVCPGLVKTMTLINLLAWRSGLKAISVPYLFVKIDNTPHVIIFVLRRKKEEGEIWMNDEFGKTVHSQDELGLSLSSVSSFLRTYLAFLFLATGQVSLGDSGEAAAKAGCTGPPFF